LFVSSVGAAAEPFSFTSGVDFDDSLDFDFVVLLAGFSSSLDGVTCFRLDCLSAEDVEEDVLDFEVLVDGLSSSLGGVTCFRLGCWSAASLFKSGSTCFVAFCFTLVTAAEAAGEETAAGLIPSLSELLEDAVELLSSSSLSDANDTTMSLSSLLLDLLDFDVFVALIFIRLPITSTSLILR
jgi:hypothetical protein